MSFYNIPLYKDYTEDPYHKNLYYNTLSNKFAEIPECFTLTEQSEKLEELKEKRMVIPSSLNEAEQYKQMQVQAIENDYPSSDYLLTTDDRLLRYNTNEVKIMSPIEFISEEG